MNPCGLEVICDLRVGVEVEVEVGAAAGVGAVKKRLYKLCNMLVVFVLCSTQTLRRPTT